MEYNYSDIDLAKYFSGQATPDEKTKIEEWSKASPENKELFDSARFVWERSKNTVSDNYNTESALSKVHGKLNFDSREKGLGKSRNILLFAGIAAAAAILIAVLFINKPGKDNITNIAYLEVISGNEIKYLKLADSSEVWLNKNSTLSYPEEFKGGNYKLKLNGEAYFQVSHNSNRVFSIETNSSTVKVLGTAFNLKAREMDNTNILSVTEGKVLYSKNSSLVEKVVEKGKVARISKNEESISIDNLKDDNFLSWKTRMLKFRETPFKEVVKSLSDFYSMSFEIKDTSLINLPISTTIVDQPVSEVVKLLQMSSDEIEISKTTEGYQVNRKK